jgi:hypothetical protein
MRLEGRVPFDRAGFGTIMRNLVDKVCRHRGWRSHEPLGARVRIRRDLGLQERQLAGKMPAGNRGLALPCVEHTEAAE